MPPGDKYAMGPVKVLELSGHVHRVYRGLKWLEARQNRNGSWGQGKALDRVIATCHAIMTLLAAGYPANHATVQKGIDWLNQGEDHKHMWVLWRIGPMLNIPKYKEQVERDLARLKEYWSASTAPHPDQLLELTILKVLLYMGRDKEDKEVQYYLQSILDKRTEDTGWRNRADTTANALSIISHFDFPDKRHIIDASLKFIQLKASEIDRDRISWEGLGTSTSYVVMNLVESNLSEERSVAGLIEKAVNWLLGRQHKAGYWEPEDPPYGGTGDITSPDYYTAAILRGIIAFNASRNPYFQVELMWCRQDEYGKQVVGYRRLFLLSFCLATGFALYFLWHYVDFFQSLFTLAGATIVGGIAGALALIEGTTRVIGRFRGRT